MCRSFKGNRRRAVKEYRRLGRYYLSLLYTNQDIALNRKVVSYVLLRSNIGIPTDMRVIREATGTAISTQSRKINNYLAALESVFPVSELTPFLSLSRVDKEAQLNGLANLVTGIRLFNKHLEKGGETIEPRTTHSQSLFINNFI